MYAAFILSNWKLFLTNVDKSINSEIVEKGGKADTFFAVQKDVSFHFILLFQWKKVDIFSNLHRWNVAARIPIVAG